MHMYLRFRSKAGVNRVRTNRGRTESLHRLSDHLDVDAERLRWTPVWDLWREHDAETLGFTWDDVVETWRDVNVLPDEGTDDLETACPHEMVEDDRCIFHLPPDRKSDEVVRDALVDAVQSGDAERRAFDGARFGSLDLSGLELSSERTAPIDLRFAVVDGELDMSSATVPDSMFSLRFATVHGDATFRSARFGSTVTFVGAGFRRNVSFYRARFESKARFTRTRFGTTTVGGTTEGAAKASANDPTTAGGERRYATFAKATFERRANFHGTRFDAKANFDEAHFGGRVAFVDTAFEDGAHFREATFDDAAVWRSPSATDPVDLSGAHLERGTIAFGDRPARLNLERATLGRVELAGDGALSRLRFYETELEGFDSSGHRDAFEDVSWRVHGYDPETGLWARVGQLLGLWGSDAVDRGAVAAIEGTYRRAKRGANAAGDTTAAGEFFRKEMAYRRFGHGYRLRELPRYDGWVGLWRWLANMTMSVTTGYGERPSRVVLSSVALCVGFAVAFAVGLTPADGAVQFREYLLFSFQSFITFIVGTPPVPGTDSFAVRVASAVEGFLGAFFVALFVFALTRSVHR